MTSSSKPAAQPLLGAALAFSAGLWMGAREWRPPSWWAIAIVAFVLAGMWFHSKRTWPARVLPLAAWSLLGAFFIQVRGFVSTDPRLTAVADGRDVTLTAHVIREGYMRPGGPHSVREPVDIETDTIESESGGIPVRGGVRLTIYERGDPSELQSSEFSSRSDWSDVRIPRPRVDATRPDGGATTNVHFSPLTYGTRLRLRAKLHPPRNFRNPGAFDYEGYLRDNGIVLLGSSRGESVERLPGFAGSRIELWRNRIHASMVEKIHELWPVRQAVLMDAVVLGEESFLRAGTRIEFQRSGTYHILVVSGMNLSILAFAIFWVLRQFRLDPALAAITTVVISFAYAFVVGVGPPVWRAALMLAIYLGARLLYRGRSMLNAIGAAALGILIINPHALFGASFQLTFLAVFIIAAIGVPLLERITVPYSRGLRLLKAASYDLHVPAEVAQFRLDLRLIAERLARFIGPRIGLWAPAILLRIGIAFFDLMFISALMQAGLALPMAYWFHRATTIGMPANMAVVPLTELLMPAAAAAVGLGYFSKMLARPAVWASGLALDGITGTIHWLGGSRLADLRVAMPSTVTILAALGALAFAALVVRRHRLLACAGWVAVASVALWIALVPTQPRVRSGVLEITAIDVGQGDSLLLVTPGHRFLLVDAGGLPLWMHSEFDIGEQVVSPYLWARGIEHLDIVAITHPHADHLGGMPSVIANFHPRELWLSTDEPSRELTPVIEQARKAGMIIKLRKEGDAFDYGGAHFRVLAPGREPSTGAMRANDDCLAATVGVGNTTALLAGDVEPVAERRIITQHPQAALLKVAHHGSARVTSADLLSTVHPQYAVISAGVRNVYGHPRREVLQRLQRAEVRTYRTDLSGAVSFYLDGKSVTPDVAISH
jgi:competence protein ComEC